MSDAPTARPRRRRRLTVLAIALLAWLVVAYLIAPFAWREVEPRDEAILDGPRLTTTGDGHPGDPVNLLLLGSEEELVRSMIAIGWHPADAISLESSLRIAVDSVFDRPDPDAPVSNLYLFGHRQDLAFELPLGDSPRKRHHVRFWRAPADDESPRWYGSATLDERVGLSYTTGQITHHIGPDVDAERDLIAQSLVKAGRATELRWIDDFHPQREGRNGGGDRWTTDGRLAVATLVAAPVSAAPAQPR
jgi:hypothetical protein